MYHDPNLNPFPPGGSRRTRSAIRHDIAGPTRAERQAARRQRERLSAEIAWWAIWFTIATFAAPWILGPFR